MPAFRQFRPRELSALAAFLKTPPSDGEPRDPARALPDRYTIDGYPLFLDPHGVPAIAPPWGTLNAIDLVKGDIVWKVPLGEYPELVKKGIRNTGTLNFGGAVATAGGVIFIAATADEKIRAFEKSSGRLLWEHQLPAGGYATPSIYMIDGRQYIVDRRRRQRQERDEVRRLDHRLRAAAGPPQTAPAAASAPAPAADGWIDLFDGTTLNGWVHMNGAHRFTVEDGAIVGRTVEASASMNSFLCTLQEFDDFELELETAIDPVTNSGIQIRTQVRPVAMQGRPLRGRRRPRERAAGRDSPRPTRDCRRPGMLYGEAHGHQLADVAAEDRGGTSVLRQRRLEQGANRRERSAHPDLGQRPAGRGHRQRGGLQDAPARVHRPADPRPEPARGRLPTTPAPGSPPASRS